LRLRHLHAVHDKWPVAADVTCSMVYLCVCLSVRLSTRVNYNKTAGPVKMPFGADSCESKESC